MLGAIVATHLTGHTLPLSLRLYVLPCAQRGFHPNLSDELEKSGIGRGSGVQLSERIVEASTKSWAVRFSLVDRCNGGKHEGWRILLAVPADGMDEELERLVVHTVVLQIPAIQCRPEHDEKDSLDDVL